MNMCSVRTAARRPNDGHSLNEQWIVKINLKGRNATLAAPRKINHHDEEKKTARRAPDERAREASVMAAYQIRPAFSQVFPPILNAVT